MFQNEIFILKLLSKDALATCTVVVGKIPSLAHEPRNDTVKLAPSITKTEIQQFELKPLHLVGDRKTFDVTMSMK